MKRTKEQKRCTVKFYNGFAEKYDKRHKLPEETILKFADLIYDIKNDIWRPFILDAGCGPGNEMEFIRFSGIKPVGIDASLEMLRLAEIKGLVVSQMDLENLSFKQKVFFDGVWARNSLLHCPPRMWPRIINELCALLKQNGIFFLGCKRSRNKKIETEYKMTDNGNTYYCYWPIPQLLKMLETECPLSVIELKIAGLDPFGERQYIDLFARKV